jgi:replicative DNA helicase
MLDDVFSERAVLAGILRYGSDAYLDCSDIIDIDTFTLDSNQYIYKCIKHVFSKDDSPKFDVPTIISAAKQVDAYELLSQPDEKNHLKAIFQLHVDLDNVRKFAVKIKKLSVVRTVRERLKNSIAEFADFTGDETVDEIIAKIETPILDISNDLSDSNSGKITLLSENLDEYIDHVVNNQGKAVGISTGYKIYDKYLGGGLRRGTVNLFGARTGVGKSLFSDNIALHIAGKLGIPVLYVDTEMFDHDHYPRQLGMIAGVPCSAIEDGSFSHNSDAEKDVHKAVDFLKRIPISYVNTNNRTFSEALSIIRRWIIKEVGLDENGRAKDCVVIYDYFKPAATEDIGKNIAEFQLLGYQMDNLRSLAAQYVFPIFALVQLNRDGISRDDTGVIAGSDRITHPAATFALYRAKDAKEIGEDGPQNGNRRLMVLKSRHGPCNNAFDYICMNMDEDTCRISEITLKSAIVKDDLEIDNNDEQDF